MIFSRVTHLDLDGACKIRRPAADFSAARKTFERKMLVGLTWKGWWWKEERKERGNVELTPLPLSLFPLYLSRFFPLVSPSFFSFISLSLLLSMHRRNVQRHCEFSLSRGEGMKTWDDDSLIADDKKAGIFIAKYAEYCDSLKYNFLSFSVARISWRLNEINRVLRIFGWLHDHY